MVLKSVEINQPSIAKANVRSSSLFSAPPFPIEGHSCFNYDFYVSKQVELPSASIPIPSSSGESALFNMVPSFRSSISAVVEQERMGVEFFLFDHSDYDDLYVKCPFIVYVGGIGGANGNTFYDDLCLYHVKKRTWHTQKTTGDKPIHRQFHAIAICQEYHRVYLIGGAKRGWSSSADHNLYYLDLKTFVWHVVTPKSTSSSQVPCARNNHAMVCVNKRLFLFGGSTSSSWSEALGDMWMFDIDGNEWSLISSDGQSPFPSARHSHVMHAVNARIYLLGGTLGKPSSSSSSNSSSSSTAAFSTTSASDIWLFSAITLKWKKISDFLLGHGVSVMWNEDLEEEVEIAPTVPVIYPRETSEKLLRSLPMRQSGSCLLGKRIVMAGGENVNGFLRDVIVFDTERYTLDLLGWDIKTIRHTLCFCGAQIYVTGGRYVKDNSFHFMTEVSIPGSFPLKETELQLLAEVIMSENEFDHTKGVLVLTELVEQQSGRGSVIDTSDAIQQVILKMLKKAKASNVQVVLQMLLNYFELDGGYLAGELTYEVLQQTLLYLEPLVRRQKSITSANTNIVELSLIRQLIRLFQYIALNYEHFSNYTVNSRICSVLQSALSIPHLQLKEELVAKDLDFYSSYYQIICHVQSVAVNVLAQLSTIHNFAIDCNFDAIQKATTKYLSHTEYVTIQNSDALLRQFDSEIIHARVKLRDAVAAIRKTRDLEEKKNKKLAKRTSTITSMDYLSARASKTTGSEERTTQEGNDENDGDSDHGSSRKSQEHSQDNCVIEPVFILSDIPKLNSELFARVVKKTKLRDILRVEALRNDIQRYIHRYSNDKKADIQSLLFWCHIDNFKYLMRTIDSEDATSESVNQVFEELEAIHHLFFSNDSEYCLDAVMITGKYRKMKTTLDMLLAVTEQTQREDIIDNISRSLFDPVLKDIEDSFGAIVGFWTKSQSFKELEKRHRWT